MPIQTRWVYSLNSMALSFTFCTHTHTHIKGRGIRIFTYMQTSEMSFQAFFSEDKDGEWEASVMLITGSTVCSWRTKARLPEECGRFLWSKQSEADCIDRHQQKVHMEKKTSKHWACSFYFIIIIFTFYNCVGPDVIPCGWLGLKHQLTN